MTHERDALLYISTNTHTQCVLQLSSLLALLPTTVQVHTSVHTSGGCRGSPVHAIHLPQPHHLP